MAFNQIWSFFVLVILIGNTFYFTAAQDDGNSTSGLRCYSCADTGENNRCDDYNTYKHAMAGKGDDSVKKDCIYPYNVTCSIETYQTVGGGPAAHIRDCSDGKSFSFTAFDLYIKGVYNRLESLIPNNETACVWDGNNLVCLSLCAENFCNGPQLKEVVNGSQGLVPSLFMAILIFAIGKLL